MVIYVGRVAAEKNLGQAVEAFLAMQAVEPRAKFVLVGDGPERAALVLGPPMYGIVLVLRPLIGGINALANGLLRLMRIEPKDELGSTYTREEVAALVEESHGEGLLAEDEYDRLAGALGFTEKAVGSILMTPDTLATVAPTVLPGRRL